MLKSLFVHKSKRREGIPNLKNIYIITKLDISIHGFLNSMLPFPFFSLYNFKFITAVLL